MSPSPIIVWLRNDLRVEDHEAISLAAQEARGHVICVYCLDEDLFQPTPLGFPRMGSARALHLLESLESLRQALERLNSALILRRGKPQDILPALATEAHAQAIYWHAEATSEERRQEEALTARCQALGLHTKALWGHTLYHIDDLPFELQELPEVFSHFRREIERARIVPRPCLPAPTNLIRPNLEQGHIPSLEQLGLEPWTQDERAPLRFSGGLDAAHARLDRYIWQDDALRHYKETRNGLIGLNYASKLSPWLASGALSPRQIYGQVKHYERRRVKNDSTYWMIFELLWRDYFRFMALREDTWLFRRQGIQRRTLPWRQDHEQFERWRQGKTGIPFVDANMIELKRTGFMSNRGRQNVASYLAKTLLIDWRWGASYFESALVDYDPCSNWGNWQYVSGVGQDPRDRKFNVVGQGERYDKEGEYVKLWLPQLEALPASLIHRPHEVGDAYLKQRYNIVMGSDYPHPLTPPSQDGEDEQRDQLAFF